MRVVPALLLALCAVAAAQGICTQTEYDRFAHVLAETVESEGVTRQEPVCVIMNGSPVAFLETTGPASPEEAFLSVLGQTDFETYVMPVSEGSEWVFTVVDHEGAMRMAQYDSRDPLFDYFTLAPDTTHMLVFGVAAD